MTDTFGLDNDIIRNALRAGIKIKKNGEFVDAPGFISLTYIPQYNKFVLAYGTCPSDAGFVYVDKFNEDWILK